LVRATPQFRRGRSRIRPDAYPRQRLAEERIMSTIFEPPKFWTPRQFWSEHREASLNWLALGLLLAAWNTADKQTAGAATAGQANLIVTGHKNVNEL
jgi:hypothetical protein